VVVIVLIIGLTSWMYLARIVRAQFLSLKENDFVLAARATGTSQFEIIFRHILPNSIAPIVVTATLGIANAILAEAYISFLGLGVQPPTATWGNMLDGANNYLESALAVVLPRTIDFDDSAEHQFPGRRATRCPGSPQPRRIIG
jgi:peptide/nickel transport system permease protein